jgi:hypothetical protein
MNIIKFSQQGNMGIINKQLSDSAPVNDSFHGIRGMVTARRMDGSIIFTKHNMILSEGRKIIRDKIFGTSTYSLSGVRIGTNETPAESSNTAITVGLDISAPATGDNITYIKNASNYASITGEACYLLDTLSDDKSAKVYIYAKAANESASFIARELGLVFKSGSNEVLFSRVVFEPIALTTTEGAVFEYTIYF